MKEFPDGSTYDLRNGYRSPEVVAQQKADGIEVQTGMTDEEKKNLLEGAIGISSFLAIIGMVILLVLGLQANARGIEERQKVATAVHNSSIFASAQPVILKNNGKVLIVQMGGNVVKCDVEFSQNEEKKIAHVFCDPNVATFSVDVFNVNE